MFGRGGFDPKKVQKMMKQMGVETEELSDVQEVIIKLSDKELVIPDAQVQVTEMKGQKTYQVMGEAEERESGLEISEEDIEMVIDQTEVDKETAREALENTEGDIAQAILNLKES
ncbi:hypothetical protein AKJ53_01555 [candidate division MSBL1 archaeon SCGC-AAA382F02]|uniref:Nascent polypeptide-associated complex protein n=1 Tax=candidate division MSBL1 archaeon SCGC-AAA382F02 TaxID=1698282 RepID=A0A133VHU5_9EURY|nr:hypothetical protein AKJ53_01555 [candidate division MSBL1 archaeon SCGC-AAA382F02]